MRDEVTVPYSKDYVEDAPFVDSDVIDPETKRALYAYYSGGRRADADDLGESMKQEAVADQKRSFASASARRSRAALVTVYFSTAGCFSRRATWSE